MDGLLRVLDLDHVWLPFGSGGLNEEGRKRRFAVAAFSFLSASILSSWRDIIGLVFLGSFMFSLLGLESFCGVRGLDRISVTERRKAILSFRLCLHSGLGQIGSALCAAVCGPTEVGPCWEIRVCSSGMGWAKPVAEILVIPRKLVATRCSLLPNSSDAHFASCANAGFCVAQWSGGCCRRA